MLSAKDVIKAHKVLSGVVVDTPLIMIIIYRKVWCKDLFEKGECATSSLSFKIRGAYYAISQLSKEERERGVVCPSGNHAQGVAYTCNEMKIPATIFMPITTPQQKDWQVRFSVESL